ncbi:6-phospho 3-hexuloisomerase [Methanocaldococcus villosus KIN24-T80]|uniref:6-phospho 3-hexuloisomerase n=1 Tax=Methanocaldococcus villosus KIN24-T80 TaxID=1069083 RepID=N6VTF8_9EURY|nr:6-phospho 3-hexuloisomerase [Methanocaldococcus villosus KIN24-T80]
MELNIILKNISSLENILNSEAVEDMINRILKANRIFIFGVGRSGYVGRCFAMRLIHLGLKAYFVGETVTPAYKKEDLLILISGSGKTEAVINVAKKAKKINNNIIAVVCKYGDLHKLADLTITLDVKKSNYLPLGTAFEEKAMIFFDLIVAELMKRLNKSEDDLLNEHCNLL